MHLKIQSGEWKGKLVSYGFRFRSLRFAKALYKIAIALRPPQYRPNFL